MDYLQSILKRITVVKFGTEDGEYSEVDECDNSRI